MDHLPARILVLAVARVGDRQDLAVSSLSDQEAGRVLHGQLRAEVAVQPLHVRTLVHDRPLRDEVVHVVRPVLDRRVPEPGVRLDDDLDDARVEGVGRVDRRRAPLDVVRLGSLFRDDQRALELPHPLGVDAEVGLKRDLDLHALGDVHEGAAGPDGRVERRELVVRRGHDRGEVLPEQVGVLLEPVLDGLEDHPLLLPLLAQRVVYHLRLVLGSHAGENLTLRLRNAELLERVLDLVRDIVPRVFHSILRTDVEVDLVQIELVEIAAPVGHRLRLEDLQSLESEFQHPLRLLFVGRDLSYDLLIEALAGLEDRLVLGDEVVSVLVESELGDRLVVGQCPPSDAHGPWARSTRCRLR